MILSLSKDERIGEMGMGGLAAQLGQVVPDTAEVVESAAALLTGQQFVGQ